MNTQFIGEIRPESTQAQARRQDLAETIKRKRESLDMCIESVLYEINIDHLRGSSLVCLQIVCQEIADACQTARDQAKAAAVKPVQDKPATIYLVPSAGGVESRPKTWTLAGYMKRQAEELGLQPMPLEADLLIKRVSQPGESGRFLADALLSAYRKNVPFRHSLFELINLDAEAFRLFHQVLHIRHVPGWDDNALYAIEQQIKAILEG
ncbi:hypothetical protein IVG45_09620 [Methylomonas sp. LL1]|uniref:hypothetical protein n=1 Tax=Methylomonas sp. LL1 TaxID=2785785 RepID=UPI0018C44DB9|nr:hypothetical protein [Methylomonas sp. LL1]QPK65163.1 hypothetical protein IVG45_09620 [Methylomonas sp. LL1]